MKCFNFILVLTFSLCSISGDGRLGREANDYKYTSIGIDIVQTDQTGIGAKLSFVLPGPLYAVLERRAEGVDKDTESYDRIINGARIGAQIGIGDLLSNVSAKGVNLGIKNVFDVYGELGVKSVAIDGDTNSFSEDDAQAHLIAGIRFGDSNNWEGKIFIDYSKESEVIIKPCPDGDICPAVVEYMLDEETDQKFGAGILYNINKRSAVTLELISSKVLDSSLKIGYQINF
ncbi:hypothetical protein OAX98_03445 [Gammaproteobacteria bacterium]|jgi:hypothetical protein|nr:hypothetical protein [Gammaproteobacteria bacterium]MDC3376036.1 hypothetical protein [Gammaproteobacteria bacterium]